MPSILVDGIRKRGYFVGCNVPSVAMSTSGLIVPLVMLLERMDDVVFDIDDTWWLF